jgi:hypothetical protein
VYNSLGGKLSDAIVKLGWISGMKGRWVVHRFIVWSRKGVAAVSVVGSSVLLGASTGVPDMSIVWFLGCRMREDDIVVSSLTPSREEESSWGDAINETSRRSQYLACNVAKLLGLAIMTWDHNVDVSHYLVGSNGEISKWAFVMV